MIRSCNKCKKYNKLDKYCKEFKFNIVDTTSATYCKKYNSEVHIKKKIRCANCKNLNRYGYCYEKKRCFNEEEKYKTRQCINFRYKKHQIITIN